MSTSTFVLQSAAEQVASFIRDSITRRVYVSEIPGVHQLSSELNVNHKTVAKALGLLEDEGVLISQGKGKARKIGSSESGGTASLRVGIFCLEPSDPGLEPLIDIRHLLVKAGHVPFFSTKTLTDLKMDVQRVARFVQGIEADAWIVVAASKEVLSWFADQETPAFALFGRRQEVDMASAGPVNVPAVISIVDRLVELGHRRVVMLSRDMRRVPEPAELERTFLACLGRHGISLGGYHLPHWEESCEGFQELLRKLFKLTPPTVLILHEAHQLVAVLQFISKRGIRVPQDLSLVFLDSDFGFRWCEPAMAQIVWDIRKIAEHVDRWVSDVAKGRANRRQIGIKSKFIEGGTIGPVPV